MGLATLIFSNAMAAVAASQLASEIGRGEAAAALAGGGRERWQAEAGGEREVSEFASGFKERWALALGSDRTVGAACVDRGRACGSSIMVL